MATNINEAFRIFQLGYTSLNPDTVNTARKSTENLINNIDGLGGDGFIDLSKNLNLSFGSFTRGTKIPILDDIDVIIGINGDGCSYSWRDPWNNVKVNVNPLLTDLTPLCHEGTLQLNSRKVVNQFVSKLGEVGHYRKTDISRNMQACKLELSSYPWNFDLVPAFRTKISKTEGRNYYIIPNGEGNWMKTDPRIDAWRINKVTKRHGDAALQVIRLAKYWQRNNDMPQMPSYLVEKITVDYFEKIQNPIGIYPDTVLHGLFHYVSEAILNPVADSAAIEPDLNHLLPHERASIAKKASDHSQLAYHALVYKRNDNQKACIETWGKIFGSLFPKYS